VSAKISIRVPQVTWSVTFNSREIPEFLTGAKTQLSLPVLQNREGYAAKKGAAKAIWYLLYHVNRMAKSESG
jgi:hypothetical protein